ncbi:unnamed protein product, partial [Rotaria sp. Silwood1]
MSSKRTPSILEYFTKKVKDQDLSLSAEDSIKQMTENYDPSSNQFRLDKSEKPSTTDNSIPPLTSTTNNSVLLSPTRKNYTISLSTISTTINSTSSSEPTTNIFTTSSRAATNNLILFSPTKRKNNSSSSSPEPPTNISTSSRATTNNLILFSPTKRKNNSSSSSPEPTTNISTLSSQATKNDLVLLSPTTRKNNLSALSTISAKDNAVSVSPIANSLSQTIIDISKCDLNCCGSFKAYHPLKEDELVLTTINKRSCQKKWFTDYTWLTFCKTKRKVFCHPRREAFKREIHPTKAKLVPPHVTFIVNGYCDWKNAISRFKLHEKTKLHLDSIYVINQQMKPNIAIQLASATKKQQEQRRQCLSIQISCIIYLLRQGLALRGNKDENSNLIQLLKLRSADHEYLNEWMQNKKYLSHDVVNEICKEIYLIIIRDIVKEVRLYEISAQNALTIVEAIYDVISRCGLDMINCRGQSYDGASNMSGIYGGVSSIILKQYSKAIYIHCVAHCLDLAVHDLTDQCASVGNCIHCVKDIIDFIRRSPKRLVILKNIFNQISLSYTTLTALCPTRWTMRAESYSSLLKNYEQVQEALYKISKEKGGPGLLIFTDTVKLSRAFQGSDCCLQDVFCAAEAIIHRFRRIQDDINFELFYNQVVKNSEGLTEKPTLPRLRRLPRRYESNTTLVNYASCEDFYQKQYVETLEIIINMLQTRFTQKNFKMLCEVEKFILNVSNNPPDSFNDYIKTIIDFCHGDIDLDRLKSEALMISDFFKVVINKNQMKIKLITKISTVCEILNTCEIGKQMFQEFDKLIRLYLTVPVTTATAERTFSALNRVKNTLRSSMTQSRLNHCLLAHIYK